MDRITRINRRLQDLPKGYVSRKMINGRERLYLQWREGSRIRSRYIKQDEEKRILDAVEERKRLQAELDMLRSGMINDVSVAEKSFQYNEDLTEYAAKEPKYHLMWADDVIGEIYEDHTVRLINEDMPKEARHVLENYTQTGIWSSKEFLDFLQDRIVSPMRRDIETILRRLDLTSYDPISIALKTRAISARDMIWISFDKDEKLDDVRTEVFGSVFVKKRDLVGDSVDTPEGQNVKRYGVSRGRFGIYKSRLSPVTTDAESEIAVWRLAERIGVDCCPCWRVDRDTVFSAFEYDFAKSYIVHFRELIKKREYDDDLKNLIAVRPEYISFYAKMIALDFITRQDDRHMSNMAVLIDEKGYERPYHLYDNGRSLFYEDTEETVSKATEDIEKFASYFGPSGSYLDHVIRLSDMGISFRKLLDLDISEDEICRIVDDAGLTGYRREGSARWMIKGIDMLNELG